jgi:rsbT co-antagonist protein RsbR
MTADLARLSAFWKEHRDEFLDQFAAALPEAGPSYAALSDAQRRQAAEVGVQSWLDALDQRDPAPVIARSQQIGSTRSAADFTIAEVMRVYDAFRDHLWRLLRQMYAGGDWDLDLLEQVETWLHLQRSIVVNGYGQALQEVRNSLAEREQALEDQSRLIRELSSPIVPIHEGVLVLPLVGTIDSHRATQIMESVLEQIVAYQAEVVILDITGVPVVDTNVANHLIQMARAVKLLGAQVVLVGIGAEIAQTIVQLGVELHDVTTRANLQAGIEYALAGQGFAIGPVSRAET